jgi:hypothetical protein
MTRFKTMMGKVILWIVELSLKPSVCQTMRIIKLTPQHHNQPMEFIGITEWLFPRRYIYQCNVCKKIELVNDWRI